MRTWLLLVAIAVSPGLLAQGAGRGKGKGKAQEPPYVSVPHDAHDLNGLWRRLGGVLTMSNTPPQMTPWGKAKFDAAVKAAETGCPVSKLFKAEISVSSQLVTSKSA